ncbi:unnamed protein product [Closterium sp. Naga37s-1]|nr:unnamed protein product [Closterium sp. Naga37s-1]
MAGSIVNIPGITSNGSTAALFHLILPQRYVIVLLTLVCSAVCYIERVGFSIAYTAIAIREGVDQATKGWVMSAFYYGYASSQVPGSWTSQKYGGRLVLTCSFVACSAAPNCHLIFPVLSSFPRLLTRSQWTPPHEKSRAVSLSMSGMYLGAGIAMQILPGLVASRGPESVFQLVAAMGVAWTILWVKYATDPPGGATAFAHVPVGGGMGGHKGSEAELLPLVNGEGERGRVGGTGLESEVVHRIGGGGGGGGGAGGGNGGSGGGGGGGKGGGLTSSTISALGLGAKGGSEEEEEDEEEEEEQQRLKRLGVVGVAASGLILEAFSGGEGSGGVGSGGVGGVGGAGGGGGGGGGIDPGWWWVFFTPASLCVVSALIFNAFATGERIFE